MTTSTNMSSPQPCLPLSAALHTSYSGSGPFFPKNGDRLNTQFAGTIFCALCKTCQGFQAVWYRPNSPSCSVVTSFHGWNHQAPPHAPCRHGDEGSYLWVDGDARLWTQRAAAVHPWKQEEALSGSWRSCSEKSVPWGNKTPLMVPSNKCSRKWKGDQWCCCLSAHCGYQCFVLHIL